MDDQSLVINQSKQNMIPKLQKSFVNDYDFWKKIIESTNSAIQIQNRVNDSESNLYKYDEFCTTFVQYLKQMHEEIHLTHKLIQNILLKMIKFKNQ